MERKNVLRSSVSLGSYRDFITAIFSLVESKTPSYVCFANVHMIVEAYKDPAFQNVVNGASVVAPDGKPLAIFLRWFEGRRQERVCGMDILPHLLQEAEALGRSVYFYGTTDALLNTIVQKARREYPLLRIAGYYSPPFTNRLSTEESAAIIGRIREAAPDLVFVALGCPKQEKWMAAHCHELNACLLGVGQAFHIYAGTEKRLPAWMRNLSLEWAYRLWQDPRRLWKRYAVTNSFFLLLVTQHAVRQCMRKLLPAGREENLSRP